MGKNKIYAKLWKNKKRFTAPFWKVTNERFKVKLNPENFIGVPLKEEIIFDIKQRFCGNIKSASFNVKEALVHKIINPPSAFDEYEETESD